MTQAEIEKIVQRNVLRNEIRSRPYDPKKGYGSECINRKELIVDEFEKVNLPYVMFRNGPITERVDYYGSFGKALEFYNNEIDGYMSMEDFQLEFLKERCKYDFEFWSASYAYIKRKTNAKNAVESAGDGTILFKINRAQQKLLRTMLDMWFRQVPVRIILLKARQWGGSTLVQMFFAWVQMNWFMNWNISICAHVKNASNNIRKMYEKMIKEYPSILLGLEPDVKLKFNAYGDSTSTQEFKPRKCTINIGTSENPESVRSEDINGVHLSEVGLFKTGLKKKPEDLIQSVVGAVASAPYTIIVEESTAKGVGNYFHREWQRAVNKQSSFVPVFVAWYEIENSSFEIEDYYEFIRSLNKKELLLFEQGATLENIAWYRFTDASYAEDWRMKSEYPSTAIEAFQSTGSKYYEAKSLAEMAVSCCEPDRKVEIKAFSDYGESALKNIKLIDEPNGRFSIWEEPDDSVDMLNHRYVVVVDVNRGTSINADNGVITVFDRFWMKDDGVPEIVAEWVGHEILRKFIWISVQVATLYNDALLVIESNTPDSLKNSDKEHGAVLEEISYFYKNLYARETPPEQIKQNVPAKRWGFNTNKQTKEQVCSFQQIVVSDHLYIEKSIDAINEHSTFERKNDSSLGAVDGCHDDRHITRAIGNWICWKKLKKPVIYKKEERRYRPKKATSTASI